MATPCSAVFEERFTEADNSRLAGIWNGNARLFVQVSGPVPEFVEIDSRRIKIWHPDQVRKCFICGSLSHLKNSCVANTGMEKQPVIPVMDDTQESERDGDGSSPLEKEEPESVLPITKGYGMEVVSETRAQVSSILLGKKKRTSMSYGNDLEKGRQRPPFAEEESTINAMRVSDSSTDGEDVPAPTKESDLNVEQRSSPKQTGGAKKAEKKPNQTVSKSHMETRKNARKNAV